MVMAQALFKILKVQQPEQAIDVLAPVWSLPIVARMPEVRNGLASEIKHGEFGFAKRKRMAETLRAEHYERAIILPRSFKSALIPWFARIPKRTGYRGESRFGLINDVRTFDRKVLDQTVKRFIALGIDDGQPLPPVAFPSLSIDRERQGNLLDALKLETERPVVAMMPGAEYGPAKCWPLDHFAELARKLQRAGYAVWVMGSSKDADAGQYVAEQSSAVNLCGKTSLEDVIDLLGAAEQAVSNDSGLMHVAAAVGLHVHAVYGSSTPDFTPPLTDTCDVHYLRLDCSPCFQRECPLGHLNCLNDLLPDAVFARVNAARA